MKALLCQMMLYAVIGFPVQFGFGAENSKLSWDSPKVQQLKQDWGALGASFVDPTTKSNYGERAGKLDDLLRNRLTHQEMRELADTCRTLPAEPQGFEYHLREFMVETFVTAGDRDSLVAVFSTRFPACYHLSDIEDFLVRHGEKLKDPILILGEAYSKAKLPDVRREIAQAVRRSFKGSGIRGDDDTDFVVQAMQWYEREKNDLAFNPDYATNQSFSHDYFKNPLFKRKASGTGNGVPEPGQTETNLSLPAVEAKALKSAVNSVGMKMALLPPGEFIMGSPEDEQGRKEDETPQHKVRITQPFWLGVYEVTQVEYATVVGKNPSHFSPKGTINVRVRGVDTKRFPVENVSWYDAVDFCNRLSKREGLPEYYRLSEDKPKDRWRTVKVLGGRGYRLPSEAEWEYACRAGTSTPFSFGMLLMQDRANITENNSSRSPATDPFAPTEPKSSDRRSGDFLDRPVPVGSYPPNAFGLYDMHGNVAEFCNDGYGSRYYEDSPVNDPLGSQDRRRVVQRGGQWCNEKDLARSASRGDEFPWAPLMYVGFRIAKGSGPPTSIPPGSESEESHP